MNTIDNLRIIAVKREDDEWELEVLGVPYGGPYDGKDADGEYFSDRTDLWLERIPKRPIVYYHGLNDSEPKVIGEELSWERREDGVWFRVLLDKGSELAEKVWEAAKQGIARASSGAISHLVRSIQETGEILIWPVGELSLMEGGKEPANPYAVAVPVMKAVYKQAGIMWPDDIQDGDEEKQEAEVKGESDSTEAADRDVKQTHALSQLKARATLILMEQNDE